jgi:hypothetical protein
METMSDKNREALDRLIDDLELPHKAIDALSRLWGLGHTHLVIEACNSKHAIRPRLAQKLEAAELIEVHTGIGQFRFASLTSAGVDFCCDLFE